MPTLEELEAALAKAGSEHTIACRELGDYDGGDKTEAGRLFLRARDANLAFHKAKEALNEYWAKVDVMGSFFSATNIQPSMLVLGHPEWVAKIHMDGRVEVSPEHTPNEAAKVFWEVIQQHGMKLALTNTNDEIEACAQECEKLIYHPGSDGGVMLTHAAKAIRGRKK